MRAAGTPAAPADEGHPRSTAVFPAVRAGLPALRRLLAKDPKARSRASPQAAPHHVASHQQLPPLFLRRPQQKHELLHPPSPSTGLPLGVRARAPAVSKPRGKSTPGLGKPRGAHAGEHPAPLNCPTAAPRAGSSSRELGLTGRGGEAPTAEAPVKGARRNPGEGSGGLSA